VLGWVLPENPKRSAALPVRKVRKEPQAACAHVFAGGAGRIWNVDAAAGDGL
jgi:hypothetical protein